MEPENERPGCDADLSVIIPTFNRAEMVRRTLVHLRASTGSRSSVQVVVVDNNSSDSTRAVIEAMIAEGYPGLEYLFEARQGAPNARNAGIRRASATRIAFLDDDLDVPKDWVDRILQTFDEYTDVSCFVGRILPAWEVAPPPWLTRDHWSPVALMDFGGEPFAIDKQRPLCLMSGALFCRAEVFKRVGLFNPAYLRCQDHELTNRILAAGIPSMYAPWVSVRSPITADRMTKRYHRRWHRNRGYYVGLMSEEADQHSRFSLFGVPAYAFRTAVGSAAGLVKATLTRREAEAFRHEVLLWELAGLAKQRFTTSKRRKKAGPEGEAPDRAASTTSGTPTSPVESMHG